MPKHEGTGSLPTTTVVSDSSRRKMWPKRFPEPSRGRVPGRGSRTRSPAATIVLGMKTRRTFSNGCHAISSRPTSSSGSTALGPPPWPPSVRPPTVFAALIAQPPGACSDLYATVHVASSLTNWLKRQFLAHTGARPTSSPGRSTSFPAFSRSPVDQSQP